MGLPGLVVCFVGGSKRFPRGGPVRLMRVLLVCIIWQALWLMVRVSRCSSAKVPLRETACCFVVL